MRAVHDPEPVVVTVGEHGWARRSRLADVLITDAVDDDEGAAAAAELLDAYPGLAMVLLPLPGNRIAVTVRGGQGPRVVRALACVDVATALYLQVCSG